MKKLIMLLALISMVLGVTTSGYAEQSPTSGWSQVGGTPAPETVKALINVNGMLYAGGHDGIWSLDGTQFTNVGDLKYSIRSRYNVSSLTTFNGVIYAGIWTLGGASACGRGVWAWDGSSWFQVGCYEDLPGNAAMVQCLSVVNGTLYAGTNNGVWAWNGSNWSQVNGSTSLPADTIVNSLISVDGTLYTGTNNGVWAWNGLNWFQANGSTNLPAVTIVNSLTSVNGTLYAGTNNGVWAWNGSNWSQVRGSTSLPADTIVNSIISVDGTLYGGTNNGVWAWSDSSWSQVGSLLGNHTGVLSLLMLNGTLYAGTNGNSLCSWNGSTWSQAVSLSGEAAYVTSLLSVDDKLYAGTYCGVWAWDGTAWTQVISLTEQAASVYSLTAVKNTIYAGTERGVWSWDGSTLRHVGGSTIFSEHPVSSLLEFNGILYAGTPEGVWAWDGSTWSRVGGADGLKGTEAEVLSMLTLNGKVYAGARTCGGLSAWDGKRWSQVGSIPTETEVQVSSLLTLNGAVYAGTTYYGVWCWNGSDWSQVGNLMDYGNAGDVNSLATDNGILYAGTAEGVWSWDGSTWSRVGYSMNYNFESVKSILTVNDTLYAGTINQGVNKIKLTSSLESDFKVTFTIDKPDYVVNNQVKTMDAIPFVENERTYVPVRYLALALGVREDGINWNPSTRTVIITKGNNNIILTIDSKVVNINGESMYLDVAPVIREGRTYLPARFVAEALGYRVDWDGNSRTAIITQSSENSPSKQLFIVSVNDKFGFIDATGDYVINPQFRSASDFSEGLAMVTLDDDKNCFINERGEIVITPGDFRIVDSFHNGLAQIKVPSLPGASSPYTNGFINMNGEIVVKPIFYEVKPFSEGLAAVQLDESCKWGYINTQGEIVIGPQFTTANQFSEELALVNCGGEGEGNGLYGFVDKKGNFIINPQYSNATDFSEGMASVELIDSDGQRHYSVIDKKGNVIIESVPSLVKFSEGLAIVPYVGYIDTTGKVVIKTENNQFCEYSNFSEGLAVFNWGTGRYPGCGYMDKTGKWSIEPQLINAIRGRDFHGGLAYIVLNDGIGYIDKSGNIIWQQ